MEAKRSAPTDIGTCCFWTGLVTAISAMMAFSYARDAIPAITDPPGGYIMIASGSTVAGLLAWSLSFTMFPRQGTFQRFLVGCSAAAAFGGSVLIMILGAE